MRTINRRGFLGLTSKLIGSMLLFNLLPYINYTAHAKRQTDPGVKDPNKILIVYASYHGSTAEIAKFIGNRIEKAGIRCDVKSIKEDINFSNYSEIIMGAPIHRGTWIETAIDFVNTHKSALKSVPFSCFFTCMAAAVHPPNKKNDEELRAYRQSMLRLFPDIDSFRIQGFAGKLDYAKCSFFEKLGLWLIMKINNLPAGDYRNWQAITAWSHEILKTQKIRDC